MTTAYIERELLYADQLDNPLTADWAVNSLAPAAADSLNSGISVRRFDDTIEEGVGFIFTPPANAQRIKFSFKGRAQTAPGAAATVLLRLYRRTIGDNVAVGAWSSAFAFAAISIPTNTNFQYDEEFVTLATLGIAAGTLVQFELTRDPADTLVGDWDLAELGVEFQ